MRHAHRIGVVEQDVDLALVLSRHHVAAAEEGRGIGQQCLELARIVVPLLQVVEPVPARNHAVGAIGAALGQLRLQLAHVHALRVRSADGDVELKHARGAQQALQVLGILVAGHRRRVGVVLLDQCIELGRVFGALLGDRLELALAGARAVHRVAGLVEEGLALVVAKAVTLGRELEGALEARLVHARGQQRLAGLALEEFGRSDALLDGRERGCVGRLLERSLVRGAGLDGLVMRRLQLRKQRGAAAGCGCGTILGCGHERGRAAFLQRAVEFARGELHATGHFCQADSEGILQPLAFFRRQRHDDLDAVTTLRGHADVEHALRVHAPLERIDHLREHRRRIDALGHLDGVDEADPAAQVLAQADLLLGRPHGKRREHGKDGDEDDLRGQLVHGGPAPINRRSWPSRGCRSRRCARR